MLYLLTRNTTFLCNDQVSDMFNWKQV